MFIFGNKSRTPSKNQNDNYERVYRLHEQSDFLCYINDVYLEPYKGEEYIKLEGLVAKGIGRLQDEYQLYSCNGKFKATITMEELYFGEDSVEELYGDDKVVALYPKEQDINYKAGDMLCKPTSGSLE